MTLREQIVELLQLLSSEKEQIDYEDNVRHVDVTLELISMWFDDLYHPKLGDLEALFGENELIALEEFSNFYESKLKDLPQSNGTVKTWHHCPAWKDVMLKAKQTLEFIND
ncbi:MAG: hypothetical protein OEZ58_06665 [Gammaproteobacteria bacterium]|nr:hypothetical protein [Gammaproteobacteria bacterium]